MLSYTFGGYFVFLNSALRKFLEQVMLHWQNFPMSFLALWIPNGCDIGVAKWRPNGAITSGTALTALYQPFKYEAQTALFKDPVRTAQ